MERCYLNAVEGHHKLVNWKTPSEIHARLAVYGKDLFDIDVIHLMVKILPNNGALDWTHYNEFWITKVNDDTILYGSSCYTKKRDGKQVGARSPPDFFKINTKSDNKHVLDDFEATFLRVKEVSRPEQFHRICQFYDFLHELDPRKDGIL